MTKLIRHQARRDAGYSLIEVMIAMVIASSVLGLVTTAMIGMLKSGASANSRLANLDQIRTSVDVLSKNLRTAIRPEQLNPSCSVSCGSAFEVAADRQAIFYANVGDTAGTALAPTRLTYTITVDPKDATGTTAILTETRQKVASSWTSGDYIWAGGIVANPCPFGGVPGCVTRTVARGITWPLPASNGPLFTYYTGTGAAIVTTPTPPASTLAQIASVRIALPVGDTAHPSPGVTTSVFLPNSTLGH